MPGNAGAYILGFDFGLKHIGVAVGQTLTGTARGVATLTASNGQPRWSEVIDLCREYPATRCIVGLPLNMDGSVSAMAVRAERFAEGLRQRIKLEVVLHDERLSTRSARVELARAKTLGTADTEHELAACLVLESWMREHCAG